MNRDFALPSVLGPNLALLLVIAIGLVSEQVPLESTRPRQPEAAVSDLAVADPTRTPARLWEDPLDRPSFPEKRVDACPILRSEDNTTGDSLNKEKQPTKPLVLLIPLSGRDYPEDRETRLRSRYAVVSALGRAGYIPLDRDYLRRTKLRLDLNRPIRQSQPTIDVPIAWEQYERMSHLQSGDQGGAFTDVVVMWLDVELLTQAPVPQKQLTEPVPPVHLADRLDLLIAALKTCWPGYAQAQWTIVGPQHSDHLEELYIGSPGKRALGSHHDPNRVAGGTIEIFSPRATMPGELLQENSTISADQIELAIHDAIRAQVSTLPYWITLITPNDPSRPPAPQRHSLHWSKRIKRTIPDDLRVCEALVKELALRTPISSSRQQIALIGEWDTVYGRTITRTFSVALERNRTAQSLAEGLRVNSTRVWQQQAANVHEFSYLRGLDGTTGMAANKESSDKAPSAKGDQSGKSATKPVDRPLGNSQYDYLRRLADQVRHFDRDCRADHSRLAAVGVLGSDTYDKLLVLRALRPLLPGVLFFTTDIDAAYLAPDQLEFTRNMLVASGYGLTLDPAYQRAIPPFRDGYQTAVFATCLQILGTAPDLAENRAAPTLIATTPQVFEIGTNGLVSMGDTSRPRIPRGVVTVMILSLLAATAWLAYTCGTAEVVGYQPPPVRWLTTANLRLLLFTLTGLLWCLGMAGWIVTIPPIFPHGSATLVLLLGLMVLLIAGAFRLIRILGCQSIPNPATNIAGPRLSLIIPQEFRRPRIWVLLLVATLGAILLLRSVWTAFQGPNEEPLRWASGVSCWPSELIRLMAIGLTVTFSALVERRVATAIKNVAVNAKAIARHGGPSQNADRAKQQARRLRTKLAPGKRLIRITFYGTAFMALIMAVYSMSGEFALPPVRGATSRAIDMAMLNVSLLAFLYLLFFVIDTVFHVSALVYRLSQDLKVHGATEAFLHMKLIRELVEPISTLIYYPFGVLFALIASRNLIFDRWSWPLGVVTTFGLALLLLIVAAMLLQFRAQTARTAIVESLDDQLRRKCADKDQLEETRKQIAGITGAAFTSWHRNPVFFALLIPFGGMGTLELLKKLAEYLPTN